MKEWEERCRGFDSVQNVSDLVIVSDKCYLSLSLFMWTSICADTNYISDTFSVEMHYLIWGFFCSFLWRDKLLACHNAWRIHHEYLKDPYITHKEAFSSHIAYSTNVTFFFFFFFFFYQNTTSLLFLCCWFRDRESVHNVYSVLKPSECPL